MLHLVAALAIDVEQAVFRRHQACDVPHDGVDELGLELWADAAMQVGQAMGIQAVSYREVKTDLETIRRRCPQQMILRLARRARWGRRRRRRSEITDMIHTGARVVDGDAIQAGQQEVHALRQRLALYTL